MIANNSSGAPAPFYGTTADHVLATKIILADGRIEKIGAEHDSLEAERAEIEQLLRERTAENGGTMAAGFDQALAGDMDSRVFCARHKISMRF